jgi:hypothetical protein
MPTKTSAIEKPARTKIRSSALPMTDVDGKMPEPAPQPADQERTSFASSAANSTTPEDRDRMIRETAYYLAEKDGFPAGREDFHWNQAQEQIDKMLKN